jgi:hypothetical protein
LGANETDKPNNQQTALEDPTGESTMNQQLGSQGAIAAVAIRHLVARGLNDSHFDAVVELPGQSRVAAAAESTRNDVLNG